MVRHGTARQKFCSYKTEEALQVEPQSNSNFYGSTQRGTTYKTGLRGPITWSGLARLTEVNAFTRDLGVKRSYNVLYTFDYMASGLARLGTCHKYLLQGGGGYRPGPPKDLMGLIMGHRKHL